MPNKNNPPVSEPAMVGDTFITGMLQPENNRGGIVRLVFYTDRLIGTDEERAIMARLTMEREVFAEIVRALITGLGAPL